jgi:hypothetical protein
VRLVFADTLYWGAALHPHDQYRVEVIRAREALGEVRLVTTDEVLTAILFTLALSPTGRKNIAQGVSLGKGMSDWKAPERGGRTGPEHLTPLQG